MVLAELVGAIEGVRGRAKEFQTELQKSEALTRYALIDPILCALGWDTADPAQVRPEFATESGNPDYALLWDGKPHIMIEAKALGKTLDVAKDKGFQCCWKNKVPYYVITDGNVWEVHDLWEMGERSFCAWSSARDLPGRRRGLSSPCGVRRCLLWIFLRALCWT